MNKRFVSVFVFALLVSAVASIVFYRLIASRLATAAKPVTTRVIVASRNLAVGTLIRDVDLRSTDWAGAVPAQAAVKAEDVVGRGVVANIYEGEPVLESRLAPKGAGAGLAATIPPGMRAVAVRVNEVVGVAGFVVPGMRVDILIFGNPPTGSHALGTQARTILQNMEVLSAGQNIQKDNEGKPVSVQVVNLLTTPEQAEILSLAANDARIQLVLRNPLDTQEAKTPGTALANLFTGAKFTKPKPVEVAAVRTRRKPAVVKAAAGPPARASEPAPPPVIVEVLHGGRKTEAKFEPAPGLKQ